MPTTAAIPQTNPKASYLAHQAAIDAAVQRVLQSGWYILGQENEAFEREFAAYGGVAHALGVGNGTDALELALRAAGIGPGDAVVTVSLTAVATVAAIELVGATPVLVDVDPVTYTMDLDQVEALLERPGELRLRAIVPVHLYGMPVDMPRVMALAERHGLVVVEDCAQAHGATLGGRKVGTWGHMAAYSFYPTKNLGALGDGGAVTTNDPALAAQARLIREYGWKERYISAIPGMNTRLDELQAAILRVKLPHLEAENARRREVAGIYDRIAPETGLTLPARPTDAGPVYHQYVVRHAQRDRLQAHLKAHGVMTLVHYPAPVHTQPAYAGRVPLAGGGLPHTERACTEVLSLPMYPQLSRAEAERVLAAVNAWTPEA